MTARLSGHGRGGVAFEDIKVGEGAIAQRGATVEVCYSLSLNRGERVRENQACSFRLGERRVIPALEYGVEGMRVGGERRVRAGPHLAYGGSGIPGIVPANAIVELRVTLLGVNLESSAGP